uniref:Uncharacterized protein n=1 Tax=Arundo donax TaxID=35708 RepID=A0A0A9E3P7_ARUDO
MNKLPTSLKPQDESNAFFTISLYGARKAVITCTKAII